MGRGIREIQNEIDRLSDFICLAHNEKVRKLIEQIRKENEPRVAELKKELEAAKAAKPSKKPRWPEDTPENVLAVCTEYWKGTTDFDKFRVHCWNDKGVWTSYPAGGYSIVGGWVTTPATFYLISMTGETEYGNTKKLMILEGHVSLKKMQEELSKL